MSRPRRISKFIYWSKLHLYSALGIVAFINSVDDYPELFSGSGEMPVPYTITLREDAKPYAVSAPRRVPLPLMDKVKEELIRLESFDVIKCVTEPSDWCAPIVVVPKKDSEGSQKVRLCVDYTELNKAVRKFISA